MEQSNKKITAIYIRVASASDFVFAIQKQVLREYAEEQGHENIVIFGDNGFSGTTDKRPQFQKLLSLVKADKVKTIIVKDISRLGRNYLLTGEYLEHLFPKHDVRLIAINDGVDTINSLDDVVPFRNIMNEWYVKNGIDTNKIEDYAQTFAKFLREARSRKTKIGIALAKRRKQGDN